MRLKEKEDTVEELENKVTYFEDMLDDALIDLDSAKIKVALLTDRVKDQQLTIGMLFVVSLGLLAGILFR